MFWNSDSLEVISTKKVDLPGDIIKYGVSQEGIIYAIVREDYTSLDRNQQLIGLSIDEGLLWRTELDLKYPNELRISTSGNCYVSNSNTIYRIDKYGASEEVMVVDMDADQEIGSFALLKEGLIICLQGREQPNAAVIKTDLVGKEIWKTSITVKDISYEGVVGSKAPDIRKVEPVEAWSPMNWLCLKNNEIIVSHNTILVGYFEMPRSGIGKTYLLDLDSGALKWNSEPKPFESICSLGEGGFLIGSQGYGAFETQRINSEGRLLEKWKSAGKTVVSKDKEISLVEMDNAIPSKLYHTKLMPGGEVVRYAQIPGYYIIHPAIDHFGNIVFWRDNRLIVIDEQLTQYSLANISADKDPFTSRRMLLFGQGQLVFALNRELFLLKTNLGHLADSSWACKFGNNERNPVLDEAIRG